MFFVCPYYSVDKYNRLKNNLKNIDEEQDWKLISAIDYNEKIKTINSVDIPRISLDIIQSSKKRGQNTKYRKNFNLFYDGIHPIRQLATLWIHKIIKTARDLDLVDTKY